MESFMRSKLLTCAAASAFAATAVLATIGPTAAEYGYSANTNSDGYTYGWGFAPDPRYATEPGGYAVDPGYGSAPGYAYEPRDDDGTPPVDNDAYCSQRFRSYDPGSGTYLGYDGVRHPCP
jgi:BA14K-like protein